MAETAKPSPKKTTVRKTSSAKTSKTAPKKSKEKTKSSRTKPDAAVLQSDLNKLEGRLKRADTLTRKSVNSLETIVETLEKRVSSSQSAQKGQLTKHFNKLSEKLDRQLSETREEVRKDLKAALSQGGLDTLETALARAADRVDAAELAQAEAITKINRHLADLARAVDARLEEESATRRTDIASIEERLTAARSEIDERVGSIERDSANALVNVGQKIETLHAKLQEQRGTDHDIVTEKVNELALQTQVELEKQMEPLAQRLETLEAQIAKSGQSDHTELSAQINQLQSRIDKIEQLQSATPAFGTKSESAPTPSQATATPPPKAMRSAEITPFPGMADNPYASALSEYVPAPDTPQAQGTAVEFNPRAFAPTTPMSAQGQVEMRPQTQAEPLPAYQDEDVQTLSMALQEPAPVAAPPPMPAPSSYEHNPYDMAFESAPMPDAPYANPAYAEDGSPKAVRVTDDGSSRLRKLPINGQAVRIGLLATGVAVVGLFAAKSLLGTGSAPDPAATQRPASPAAQPELPDDVTLPPDSLLGDPAETTVDPIGNYEEAQPVIIDEAQLGTLEQAVAAGNPVAQFQMGLTRLESGATDEGVQLIQLAADAGQPAAIYRLAKLHETGTGVTQNEETARRLIERAARAGNRIAMHDLALFHVYGQGGLETDVATGMSWFEEAARRGVVDSQFNLARLSESTDTGLTPNLEAAYFWFSIAAMQGDQFAQQRSDALRNTLEPAVTERLDARIAAFEPQQIDPEANGIFTDLPWQQSGRAPAASREQVREVQSLLSSLGYDIGTADGLMGNRTRNAILAFEAASGLPQTGQVKPALIEQLSTASGV